MQPIPLSDPACLLGGVVRLDRYVHPRDQRSADGAEADRGAVCRRSYGDRQHG